METYNYKHLDVSLDEWKKQIKAKYPRAVIYVAPEEEGGTRNAFSDGDFVGDWDGSSDPCGRIVID